MTGYQKRKYLENIIPDDVSQYKFYQGMIQDRGTKNVLNKLFDNLGSANKDSIEFLEEWAVRVGRYGATEGDDTFEVLLDEQNYRLEPCRRIGLRSRSKDTLIIGIDRNNVFVKLQNYDLIPLQQNINDENIFVPPRIC